MVTTEMLELSNAEIYNGVQLLNHGFCDSAFIQLPVMVNYAIQYNLKKLLMVGNAIDRVRMSIGAKYGELTKDNDYHIPDDKIELAQRDMDKLMDATEKLQLKVITLDELQDMKLTPSQMQSLLFMIKEE